MTESLSQWAEHGVLGLVILTLIVFLAILWKSMEMHNGVFYPNTHCVITWMPGFGEKWVAETGDDG